MKRATGRRLPSGHRVGTITAAGEQWQRVARDVPYEVLVKQPGQHAVEYHDTGRTCRLVVNGAVNVVAPRLRASWAETNCGVGIEKVEVHARYIED